MPTAGPFDRFKVCFLFIVFMFLVILPAMAFCDGTAVSTNDPWYVKVILVSMPLIIYLVSQIRSHLKDGTIKEIANIAAQGKKYEPLGEEALKILEAKYPVLKVDVQKVQALAASPTGQAVQQVAQGAATALLSPAPAQATPAA
jgi:hypothetical protein